MGYWCRYSLRIKNKLTNIIKEEYFHGIFLLISLIFFITSPQSIQAQEIEGVVTRIIDGDTVVITPSSYWSKSFSCRLYGIDAPEIQKRKKPGQPYGIEAKQELESMIYRQKVKVSLAGEKTYRREVCVITKGDRNINLEMVKRGYAWAYRQYLHRPYASEYLEAEKEAREKRLGLWNFSNPQPPWEWRKMIRIKKSRYIN